ncbi:UDP-glycosyltransferase 73B1-like [Cucurbita maxima]|uniref:UDP-glycosyltransferase 73B1-like n=1 Tax=Cucurbita maxima TaxID=3661 RepID=A0A6J1IVU1_CUCMA|nr:UDP-glycosyltransferase 73B1-like [Cucurbita maxima]
MVDQIGILFHKAIGGFLSHCGWNSIMERLAAAVPILAWPMMSEQKLNEKYISEGLGIGIAIERGENGGRYASREKISASVRELMIGEKGKRARERAGELARVAQRAVQDGGSSDAALMKNLELNYGVPPPEEYE